MISPAGIVGERRAMTAIADAARAPDGLPYDWPGRSSSSQVEVDGVRWHVQRSGAGPALLLIHGTAASTHTWRDLMPILATSFDVVAMDLPGHGYTTMRPDGEMTLEALSASVASLTHAMGFSPDFVVGHSAGAAIGLRMSLNGCVAPRNVVGLNAALLPFGGVLKGVFSPLANFFATTRMMPRMVARRANDLRAVRRVLVGTGSDIDDRGVELYRRLLTREGHVAAVLQMMASWNLEPLLADLPGLDATLYLLAGGRDKAVSPDEAHSIARRLPGVRVTALEDCGHLAHEEAPGKVAELILAACAPDRQRAADD